VTALERFGAHAAGGCRELSAAVRDAVRLHLADTVGAWIAAGGTAEGRALLRFEAEWNPDGEGMAGRVARGCALARLSEADDIHLFSATTPGALVVPAALAIAAEFEADGETLAEAIAVGYDAVTRLGAALDGAAILYRGIWPTYLAAPFGVAAVAARLMGLDPTQAAHALGIALALSSPSVGRQTGAGVSRWLAIGNAARNGVVAALAAQAGFTGDLRLFEGEFFSGIYRLTPDEDALTGALDERVAVTQTSFKPWCAARQTMAAAQAIREIVDEGVAPSAMSEIVVGVPRPYLKMIDHGVVGGDRASHLTSVAYQMALAALDPDASLDLSQSPELATEDIGGFMARISVKADESLAPYYPKSWPARVVVAASGRKHEKTILQVPGDPERPLGEAQLAQKFRRLAAPVVGEGAAENMLQLSLTALDDGPLGLLEAIEAARSVL
jgi:2-methylcitrate dehydratase PrpD